MDAIQAAKAEIKIWYNDKEISADVAGALTSLEYSDFGDGQIDDLQVAFADPDGRWRGAWNPERGATLRAEIVQSEGGIIRRLPCGTFTIDSPEYNSPGSITMKGLAASMTSSIRKEKRTRAWSSLSLKALVAKIAGEHPGVSMIFEGDDSPVISKVEQKNETDLQLLSRYCEQCGYALKIDSNRLVVYRREEIDSQAPVLTLTRTGGRVLSYRFASKSLDCYRACCLKFKHPDKGLITATYTDPSIKVGQTLQVRCWCDSQAEALEIAKHKLRAANRGIDSAELTLVGDVRLASGIVVRLLDFGVYDGLYTIDEARHTKGGGYTVGTKLVRVGV